MIDALEKGARGVRLVMPTHLKQRTLEADFAELVDPETRITWQLFTFDGVYLDLSPEHRDDLRRSAEAYARDMFDKVYRGAHPADDAPGPRTADPAWSALIDFEPVRSGGASALVTTHRMVYEPGREVILGHLLVPLATGLFEARAVAGDSTTGMRESALMLLSDRLSGDPNSRRMLSQAEMDDPRHDSTFPEHVLSRIRSALSWIRDDAGLEVLAPAERTARAEVELHALGCALRPPPRFVQLPKQRHAGGWFTRTSFCATDGVETFGVCCAERDLGRIDAASRDACAIREVRARTEEAGVRDAKVSVFSSDGESLVVMAEGEGHLGALRNAFCWFVDEAGRPWYLCIPGIAAISREERARELAAARATFRLTQPAPEPKPWWRLW